MNKLDNIEVDKYLDMSMNEINNLFEKLKPTINSDNLMDNISNLNMSESDLDNLLIGITL